MKNLRTVLIASGILLLVVSVFFLGLNAYQGQQQFRGSAIGTPAPQALDFTLQRPDGTDFQLSQETGKVVLIYLGYTNCPDYCPATLGKFKQVAEELKDQAANVDFVFITVDPDRDTPEVLGQYMDRFNSDFIGLTGSADDLQKVWTGYGAGVYKEDVNSDLGYVVAHSTRVWVIDKQGLLRITFPFEMTADDIAHDVSLLLAE